MAPRKSRRLENKEKCLSSSILENHSKPTAVDSNKAGQEKNKSRKTTRKSASKKSLPQVPGLPTAVGNKKSRPPKNNKKTTTGKSASKKSLPQVPNPVTLDVAGLLPINNVNPLRNHMPQVIDIADIPPLNPRPIPLARNGRPQVISLDVTDSESSSESDVEEISTPEPKKTNSASMENASENPDKFAENGRCTLSDSDEEFVPDFDPTSRDKTYSTRKNKFYTYDSDSDVDIYKVNYNEEREKAFEAAAQELHKLEKKKKRKIKVNNLELLDNSNLNDSLSICGDDDENNPDFSLSSSLEDPTKISTLPSLAVKNGKRGRKRCIVRTSKKTKMALESLEAFSKKFDAMEKKNKPDDSLCEDIIMIEDSEVTIRICWGLEYTRHKLKKNAKLLSLYQELAEKNNASISEVVLSFKDNILSPETRPSDLKLSIADTLDGAIIRESSQSNGSEYHKEEEGSLSFKIQTSNRKEVHTISINKYDKMSILMEKYSKLRNIPLDKLRFKFDGESLEPSDTPSSLDLEGGECIDVFLL